MSEKIVIEFDRVFQETVAMKTLMVASQCFPAGIGERKLSMIEAAGYCMLDLITGNGTKGVAGTHVERHLLGVKGYSAISAKQTMAGIKKFEKVLGRYTKYLSIDGTLPKKAKAKKLATGKLSGVKVSWTGYRDKDEEAAVEKAGGEVVKFGSTTTLLIYKVGGKESTKVDKANAKGIKTSTFNKLGL
jgi:hypothetical protein